MANVPSNIPKGTYVQDGVRTGPIYTMQSDTRADVNGVLLSGNRGRVGPGILLSPTNGYNFVPYCAPGAPGTAGATAPDVVGTQTLAATGTRDLTLVGNGTSAVLTKAANGSNYLQFDWPRVVAVTVAVLPFASPTTVTIFGFDYYGFPMQHTYTIQAVGTYPNYTQAAIVGINPVQGFPTKAFYGVTRVSLTGSLIPATTTISLQTTNTFGLPYRVSSFTSNGQFGWATMNMNALAGVTPAMVAGATTLLTRAALTGDPVILTTNTVGGTQGILRGAVVAANTGISVSISSSAGADTSTVSYFLPNSGKALLVPADLTATATATTGDVRGLIVLPEIADTWAPIPDGLNRCIYNPYVRGADQFQNQLAAANQPQGLPAPSTTPYLTSADLYGVKQYYTGVPA